jgi:GT2 family glycosyltransferase
MTMQAATRAESRVMPQAAMIDISILIVSYNTRAMTLEAIRSAFAETTDASVEIICVDNASTDGSAAAIAHAFPQVDLIALDKNVGFAAGNNIAAARATGKRLLLLNPDTITIDRGIDELWRFAERRPECGIWGGRTLFADRSLNPTSCWARMTPWNLFCRAVGLTYLFPRSELFNGESYGDWPRDHERPVDIVTGCFLMIDRALWEQLGGFDKTFFMYGEEADLCHRAVVRGARPMITPAATIIHIGGGSEASSADKLVKTLRGKVTLMRVHWGPLSQKFGLAMFLWLAFVRRAASAVLKPGAKRGGGSDADENRWVTVWRRRHEWLAGWQRDGKPV